MEPSSRSAGSLIALGVLAGVVVIGTRLLWLHTAPYLVRALDRRPQQRGRRLGWRPRTVVAWSGLRGAVSLAAALALPSGFPERDLLVWMTLCVIFATLVFQGLTFPILIRVLGVEEDDEPAREELVARKAATRAALDRIDELREEEWTREDSADRLRAMYEFRQRRVAQRAGKGDGEEEDLDERSAGWQRMIREVLDTQRDELVRLRDDGRISDEVMRVVMRELDLEDQRLEI